MSRSAPSSSSAIAAGDDTRVATFPSNWSTTARKRGRSSEIIVTRASSPRSTRVAAVPTFPDPMTTARPEATPPIPPSSFPRPAPGFFSRWAPTSAAIRPAICDIGARQGNNPLGNRISSGAIPVAFASTIALASDRSAAICRYPNTAQPSCSSGYSAATGSFTFTSSSTFPHTASAPSTIEAPARSYEASLNELPSPAPRSISTSWPRCRSVATASGVRPTRSSPSFRSATVPILIPSPIRVRGFTYI